MEFFGFPYEILSAFWEKWLWKFEIAQEKIWGKNKFG